MSIKDITVIITTFKSDDKIKQCLNSIDKQTKVILVENSDRNEFKKKIEEEFNNVNCILSGANLGYGAGNNIGLKKVLTKYALILNPDATLHQSTLTNFFEETKKIPNFAIMGPLIQDDQNENKNIEKNKPLEVKNLKGFAMFLNLPEFKDIGFFDEDFFFYFEEIDLCKRVTNKRKKIYLLPNVKVHHDGGQSHKESINKEMELSRNWHWMWSTFYFHKKHKGFIVSFFIVLPKLSSAVIKVLIYSLLFNKEKKKIYYQRMSGLINAMTGKSSWYRPNV
ncbi:MAG TPA: glycosyltransferase [Candidatus Pelagibacter sp.]|jgi:GT2 family glycosyltransferase|nr:glycosyltransferase [Candidatus Pelagibacter sp.]